MGKVLQTKYADINHQIIKNLNKRDKSKQATSLSNNSNSKRKSECSGVEEPSTKKVKVSDEDVIDEEEIENCKLLSENILTKDFTIENVCVEQGINSEVYLKIQGGEIYDLFLDDELKNCYSNFTKKDFYYHIIEEIALEGLDGITIEDFWKRFSNTVEEQLDVNDVIKEIIWYIITDTDGFQFFQLPEPRTPLDIHNRYKYFDSDVGVVMEMAVEIPDIYPHQMVNSKEVQGSCSTFNERKDITDDVKNTSLKDALEKYGRTLVIVATQRIRTSILYGQSADPMLELKNQPYCILERIGRSRNFGEQTQGVMSINAALNMDSKSLFHYLQPLISQNLISKQFFLTRSFLMEQNQTGRLLHLERFYRKFKTKPLLIAEKIVSTLKRMPGNRMPKLQLKQIFPNLKRTLHMLRCSEANKFILIDSVYPYRSIYPNAKAWEYMMKGGRGERYVKCVELIDPYVNVTAAWLGRNQPEESDDEEEDEMKVAGTGGKIYNMDLLKEMYYHIVKTGHAGLSMQEISGAIGIHQRHLKTCLRRLEKTELLRSHKVDEGRQRILKFTAKCWDGIVKQEEPPIESRPVSKFKMRILEKQKAAIEKQELNVFSEQEGDREVSLYTGFKKIVDLHMLNVPKDNMDFFVGTYGKLMEICFECFDTPVLKFIQKYSLKIKYRHLTDTELEFDKILCQLRPKLMEPLPKSNVENIVISNFHVNFLTKLILLKAHFKEVTINNETMRSSSRKRKLLMPEEVPIPQLEESVEKFKINDEKLLYMGENPQTVFHHVEGDIETEIIVSTDPGVVNLSTVYTSNAETSRVVSRMQKVLDEVHQKRVVEDIYHLNKLIVTSENNEGYMRKIDRRSLLRILKKLVDEGYIKIFKVTVHNNEISKTQHFICHPEIFHTDSLIVAAHQQMKWKYFIGTEKRCLKRHIPTIQKNLENQLMNAFKSSPFKQSDVMDSIAELHELSKLNKEDVRLLYPRSSARLFGYKPKFIRMCMLHEFMFYLVYEYTAATEPLSKDEVMKLFMNYGIDVPEDIVEQMPPVYCRELSWKMFIPPLPAHKEWPIGWVLMCDIFLRLPISVFCKIHQVNYECPELRDILNHPIKRFYLIKDMPQTICNLILFKKTYMSNITTIVRQLAICGLVQFGPQKSRDKDRIFIYLNRRASLLDTTSSGPQYNRVTEKEYDKLLFYFNNMLDLDSYWHEMYRIGIKTLLNTRVPGQIVTYSDYRTKLSLKKAFLSKSVEQTLESDNGDLPGDQRGAAGLDSSMYTHMTKNWCWTKRNTKTSIETPTTLLGLNREKIAKFKKIVSFDELKDTLNAVKSSNKVYLNKKGKDVVIKKKMVKTMPTRTTIALPTFKRRLANRPKKESKSKYHDHVDKMILKRIGKMRVKWSEKEERLLLLLKVGDVFLCRNKSLKQLIPYNIMRDILHRISPDSKNKTSRACQRCIKKLLRTHSGTVKDSAFNLMNDHNIRTYFSMLNYYRENPNATGKVLRLRDTQMTSVYVILMSYILHNKNLMESILEKKSCHVDHLTEENLEYTENNHEDGEIHTQIYADPKTEEDINISTIKAVVLSSLIFKNQAGWTAQLLRIYEKYNDNLIRLAVEDMKKVGMLSCRKFHVRRESVILQIPFKIHNNYVILQNSTFHVATALEAYKSLLNALTGASLNLDFTIETVKAKHYGQMLGYNEFASFWNRVDYKFNLPTNTVILNTDIEDHSKLLNELATRLQIKMKRIEPDINDIEQEIEDETDVERKNQDDPEVNFDADKVNVKVNKEDEENAKDSIDDNNDTIIDAKKNSIKDNKKYAESVDRAEDGSMVNKQNYVDRSIPTLEELKKEMMRYTEPGEERIIPHVTELIDLLDKEEFSELNTSDETLAQLKKHFKTQHAVLEDLIIKNHEELNDDYMIQYLTDPLRTGKVWEKVKRDMIMMDISTSYDISAAILAGGGHLGDVVFTNEIMEFIKSKNSFGATAQEIKNKFQSEEGTMGLVKILSILVENGILLRTGICSITFVYFKFRTPWLIRTFVLSDEEQKTINVNIEETKTREKITEHFRGKKEVHALVMPWSKVDGSLNEDIFKIWLCNILSQCLNKPKIKFTKLCEKFRFVKPVEIYYLLEILQELKCINMVTCEDTHYSLFSEWEPPQEGPATFLSNLEDIVIETNNVSMTCLGSLFGSQLL